MHEPIEKVIREVYGRWKKEQTVKGAHPDDETFAAFAEGRLPEEEAAKIKEHILSCEACALALTCHLAPTESPACGLPPGLAEKCRSEVNHRLDSSCLSVSIRRKGKALQILNTTGDVQVGQELVPATVFRSRKLEDFGHEVVVLKDFKELRVELKIEKKDDGFAAGISVRPRESLSLAADLRVSLLKDGRETESYLFSGAAVRFEHLSAGKYSVELTAGGERLAMVFLDIKS